MSAAYYAAGFAQDLRLSETTNVTLGYASGTASLAEVIGTLMEAQHAAATMENRNCWPLAGAEAAAAFLNNASDKLPLEELHSGALAAATYAALTEGK